MGAGGAYHAGDTILGALAGPQSQIAPRRRPPSLGPLGGASPGRRSRPPRRLTTPAAGVCGFEARPYLDVLSSPLSLDSVASPVPAAPEALFGYEARPYFWGLGGEPLNGRHAERAATASKSAGRRQSAQRAFEKESWIRRLLLRRSARQPSAHPSPLARRRAHRPRRAPMRSHRGRRAPLPPSATGWLRHHRGARARAPGRR